MPFSPFPTYRESDVVWCNDETISTAKPVWTGSGTGPFSQFLLYLGVSSTLAGTYNWEEVTSGINHGFSYSTGKFLKWKAIGMQYRLTSLTIDINH